MTRALGDAAFFPRKDKKSVLGLLSHFQPCHIIHTLFSSVLETSTTNINNFSHLVYSRMVVMVKCLVDRLGFVVFWYKHENFRGAL